MVKNVHQLNTNKNYYANIQDVEYYSSQSEAATEFWAD